MSSEHHRSQETGPAGTNTLWPVDLKLTHVDWNHEASLIHFQGQYLTICDLDYNILQGEIQNIPKTKAVVDVGEFCLVEDVFSARWYRGRVENQKQDLFDVFLIDHGNILSVDLVHISSCSNDLFILPPKIVCGFFANVLLLDDSSSTVVEGYLSSLVGRNITGYIHAFLPQKVLLLEAPDINNDLVTNGYGRHVDTDTFLFLVGIVTEVPLKLNRDPVPDLLIEKQRREEFIFKPSRLRGYEDILPFCGPKLSCGTRAKVRVTAAVNPGLFYCQVASMEPTLWEMSKKLAAVCKEETDHETSENLGPLCSVKGKDGKWYRGFLQLLPVNSQVQVLFMDYGFCESVKIENVHRLPTDFYSVPIMAFPCSLSSLNVQDEAIRAQQLNFLKAGLLGEVLDVEFSSSEKAQHLYSITVVSVQDKHVKEPEPSQEVSRKKVEAKTLLAQCGYLYYNRIISDMFNKTLEVEEVQENSLFVGYVEHVQNPHQFWVRTQKRNDEFEEMLTKMSDYFFQAKLDEDTLVNPDIGTMCCALYERDMHYYRGVVIDILDYGFEVLFIDFGNIEKVPRVLVKKIPETFSSKPAFAFCCSLVDAIPSDEVWTSNTSDFFRRAVSNKALQVHVVQKRRSKFVVDLHEIVRDRHQSITELMISSKQAEYWNNTCIELKTQNNTERAEKTRCSSHGVALEINDHTGWEDSKQEEDTCKNEIKHLSIKPGCEFAVCCSHISSPSDFWCQLLNKVPALEDLMSRLQWYYKTHMVPLQSGDLYCVAMSPLDGRWYRAFITEQQKGHVRVILVDYGFTIQVEKQNLQTLLPEYAHLEGQAFRCGLYNLIAPVETKGCWDWNPEACNSLKRFCSESNGCLKCKFVSQLNVRNIGLYNVVDLYNTQTQQSITKVLVRQGQARETTISTKQLTTVFPESFVYCAFELDLNSKEEVFVTHVSNQWEVYCQLEKNTEHIQELERKIYEESEKMKQASTRAVVLNLCLAKYLDGIWYRGLARPVQSPLHLSVFFVDYGNTIILEKPHVMLIPRDSGYLLYTPMQALKFHLASVSKKELYADVTEWLDKAILNKQVRAVIVGKNDDGSFDAELFDGDVNINEKVKGLILNFLPIPKVAVSSNRTSTKTECQTNHRKRMMISVKSKIQSSNSQRWPSNYPASSSLKKETNLKAQNKIIKVKYQTNTKTCVPHKSSQVMEQKHHVTKTEQHEHTEETEIPQLSCLSNINVVEHYRVKCFVSHINSVDSFFLQLSEDEPAILKMGDDLNTGGSRDSLKMTQSLRINDLVLAEYKEDGALYRSVVKDHVGTCLKVEFVDYGNTAVIGKEKIYTLPQAYLSQPRFSIPCSLLDRNTYENADSFTDAVMEKPLMVEFVHQCGTLWEVMIEVLGESVSAPLELAIESSTANKEKEATSVKVGQDETWAKCEAMTNKNYILKPLPSVTMSTKPMVKSCKPYGRTPTRNKSSSNKIQRKISKSFVKVKHDCTDAVITQTIQAKDTEYGAVLSVLHNGDFYVRLNKTSDLLAALESHISVNLHKYDSVAEEDIKQNHKWLVQVQKDKQWRRAVVQHINQGKCQVFLLDHGITEEIPSSSIRQQSSDMKKIPNYAMLCRINCPEFSNTDYVTNVNKLMCETLKLMIDKEVKLVFLCGSEVDNLWMVEVVMNKQFLSHQIPVSLQKNEKTMTSPKLIVDTSPHQFLSFAPIHIDKPYSGIAAAVTNPFEFCVVLEDLLVVMNKVSIMLENLPVQISSLTEGNIIPGACCMLKSETKNKWCRAEIVHAGSTIVLNLADYGHCECIFYDITKLKRLPEDLRKLPKVTYPCILRGVEPVGLDGQWTDEAAVFFQQCLYQRDLQILFREFVSNTHWQVDILASGGHVAKEMVDAGHASYIDAMLGLRFQEQSPRKACSQAPGSKEECGLEDEGLEEKSDIFSELIDKAEEKMLHLTDVF